jgi:hypothetical protein
LWVVCANQLTATPGVKFYVTITPTHQQASMYRYTYTIVEGEPCQTALTPWTPAHTTLLQGDLPTPLTHNKSTQQHSCT